jgi:hypothetical protein
VNTVISMAPVLACALSLAAQINTTVKQLPDGSAGSAEVRMRNESAVSLAAYAIVVSFPSVSDGNRKPLVWYSDELVDARPPLLPGQEFTVIPDERGPWSPRGVKPVLGTPAAITAGIFADGSTTGDTALLTRLISRRCNMLQAVETSLETMLDAGRRNVPPDQLIAQFKKLAGSLSRWYVPREQQAGLPVYQSIIAKLTNLPAGMPGAAFPPNAFVEQETALLNRQRAALEGSRPNLAEVNQIGTTLAGK